MKWTGPKGNTIKHLNNNTLVLYNVKEKDSGTYKCHGTFYISGLPFHALSQLLVAGKKN